MPVYLDYPRTRTHSDKPECPFGASEPPLPKVGTIRGMHWHRPMVSAVLIFAILASGLYVPVYHHGDQEHGVESHVHRVVHSHGQRPHVHVHYHPGVDCGGHDSTGERCSTNDVEDEHCENSHAREILLSSVRDDGCKQGLNRLRLADDVQDDAVLAGIASCEMRPGSVRPPPGRVSPPDHLHIVRSVILRL